MRISPFAVLFFALLSVPLLEIYLLISLGRVIGAGATVLVVVVTAILGAWLLRLQGMQTLSRVQAASQAGQIPAVELVEGLILLVSGVLLLTPGFFTDAIGFLTLVPVLRAQLARLFLRSMVAKAHVNVRPQSGPHTIEGSFRTEDEP